MNECLFLNVSASMACHCWYVNAPKVPNGIQTEEEEKEALKGGKGPEQRQRGGEKHARRAREEDANLI